MRIGRTHRRREPLVSRHRWRDSGAMISVQITEIPEETYTVLQRAARADQPLQEYLLGLLVREAQITTLDKVLDRADHRTGGTVNFSEAVQALRDDRDGR